mgnify:FL=1
MIGAVLIPTKIRLRKQTGALALEWPDGVEHDLSFEYLRVHSPSAEVRGHGAGEAILQTGKRRVRIVRIDPIGNYAQRLHFSDGQDIGLYSWHYLRELGEEFDAYWSAYLSALATAGKSRDSDADGA